MTLTQERRWTVFPSSDSLAAAAVAAILAAARQAIAERGAFHLVLAGGTTPRRVYQMIAAAAIDWQCWHIYFGDERCLPPDDAERNSRMASEAWLSRVPIPPAQILAIPAEHGPVAAAAEYAAALAAVELFDLVLLGLGEDGHTASLFPGQVHADEQRAALAVWAAPKPPPERVTLSVARLSAARQVIFLVTGASKAAAVAAWRRGEAIPAAAIAPAGGVDIYLEALPG